MESVEALSILLQSIFIPYHCVYVGKDFSTINDNRQIS